MTTSSERPEMALYVSGWIASVAACVRFFLPVRASTPGVALEDIVEGVTRRVSLWLVFLGRYERHSKNGGGKTTSLRHSRQSDSRHTFTHHV